MKHFILFLILASNNSFGGILIGTGPTTSVFSFRPLNYEQTPNYYGVGFNSFAGYSFDQTFDLGLFASYAPGHVGQVKVSEEQATLIIYGATAGIRIIDQAYIGLVLGEGRYRLISFTDDAIKGFWKGSALGVRIGSLVPMNKERFWQITLDYFYTNLNMVSGDDSNVKNRHGDSFQLSFTYVFNSKEVTQLYGPI